MITKENIIIENIGKKPILADVSFYSEKASQGVVVFCHGYKGFKDWGAWNLVADYFANEGFIFVKFNFSHNGSTIANPIDFPDEDAFGNNTYSIELDDVNRVIDFVDTRFAHQPIFLIGHSRGGGIAILAAAQNPKISKIISWAGVSDFKSRFPKGEELKKWKEDGVRYVLNSRTHQNLPHYYSFYEDFITNEATLSIGDWAAKLSIPFLIVHGTLDEAVPFSEAEFLKACCSSSATFFLPANHTFGVRHPWDSPNLTIEIQKVSKETVDFIRL